MTRPGVVRAGGVLVMKQGLGFLCDTQGFAGSLSVVM